jgi:hypothetical protein
VVWFLAAKPPIIKPTTTLCAFLGSRLAKLAVIEHSGGVKMSHEEALDMLDIEKKPLAVH